jgi:hypothetical protein
MGWLVLGLRPAVANGTRSDSKEVWEQMQQSLASEEGQATVADVQNFATGGVTFYFSEVDS